MKNSEDDVEIVDINGPPEKEVEEVNIEGDGDEHLNISMERNLN